MWYVVLFFLSLSDVFLFVIFLQTFYLGFPIFFLTAAVMYPNRFGLSKAKYPLWSLCAGTLFSWCTCMRLFGFQKYRYCKSLVSGRKLCEICRVLFFVPRLCFVRLFVGGICFSGKKSDTGVRQLFSISRVFFWGGGKRLLSIPRVVFIRSPEK